MDGIDEDKEGEGVVAKWSKMKGRTEKTKKRKKNGQGTRTNKLGEKRRK